MPKLNQIIAIVSGKKTAAQQLLTDAHNRRLKPDTLNGLYRTYRRKSEEGEEFPPEIKRVQVTVPEVITEVETALVAMFDAVLTQDTGNTKATSNVVVEGVTILKDIPVTFLLFLEKQVTDLETFVSKLPTLDPSETWERDKDIGGYTTKPYDTLRMAKVYKTHIQHPPTDKHPAQVTTYTVDEAVGTWTNVKKSGAISAHDRNTVLTRVQALKEAIKVARESANGIAVEDMHVGSSIFGYLFGGVLK